MQAPVENIPERSGSDNKPHALVIGAGFGGLSAAVRLGARGYRVTVIDRRDKPGGRAYVYEDKGFIFDGGPTVITAPFLFEELWELAGKKMSDDIDMREVSPFYRIRFDDGTVFDYTGDRDAMHAEINKINPADVAGYDRFVKASEQIFKVGFEQLAHVPFGSPMDMLKILPDMVRLGSHRSVYGMAKKYVKDEKLRTVLSFHPLLVGGNPFSTTSIYSLILFLERKWGVHFAMGGTGALVKGIVGLIEGLGGEVRLNQTVSEIVMDESGKKPRAAGVRLENGDVIHADLVVSNADAAWTYRHLVPSRYRRRWTDSKIDRARYSMSLFVWYFGTNRKYEDVAHHTILLGPRYKGLLDDIFENKVLADDFSLYLHRPTKTDPSMAPDGCDAYYVLSPVPHLDSGVDWQSQCEPYRKKIEQYLASTIMPDLGEHIVTSHTLDPQGFQDILLSHKGAAFSVEPTLLQSAYFRPHNQSEDIEHLYLVGAGTHPGAGMPGVISSARVLDTVVPDPNAIVRAKRAG